MKHAQIVEYLCDRLSEGIGINEALAELNLVTNYLADHLTPADRVRLHQAREIYVEGLDRRTDPGLDPNLHPLQRR